MNLYENVTHWSKDGQNSIKALHCAMSQDRSRKVGQTGQSLKYQPGSREEQSQLEEQSVKSATIPRKRNAFSELMAPRPKQSRKDEEVRTEQKPVKKLTNDSIKSGLLAYITNPDSFPSGTIVRETEHTVLVRDAFPKALVHLLLLPRDPKWYNLTPFEAFNPTSDEHTNFLALMHDEAASAAELAASELQRLVAPHSASCKARIEALEADDPPKVLPSGRNFLPEIKIGIHAQPSMNTLHIHIISVDNYSQCLKHKKHYNSFNTEFFIGLDDFPLMEEDNLMSEEEQNSLIKGDMRCWRCGTNFGNKFKQLKDHLQEEYEEWKKV